jgi:hypothetical protein
MSYSIKSTHRFSEELKRLVKKLPSLKIEFGNLKKRMSERIHKSFLSSNSEKGFCCCQKE